MTEDHRVEQLLKILQECGLVEKDSGSWGIQKAKELIGRGVVPPPPNRWTGTYQPLSPPRPVPKPSQAKKTRSKKTIDEIE